LKLRASEALVYTANVLDCPMSMTDIVEKDKTASGCTIKISFNCLSIRLPLQMLSGQTSQHDKKFRSPFIANLCILTLFTQQQLWTDRKGSLIAPKWTSKKNNNITSLLL